MFRKLSLILVLVIFISILACNPEKMHYNVVPEGAGYIEETTHENGVVTIGAYPNEGYMFDHWSEGLTGYINHCPMDMIEGNSVTANFIQMDSFEIKDDSFETNDFSVNDYQLGGDVQPFIQSDEAYDGTYAVQFGDIEDDQSSFFEIKDVTIDKDVNMSFNVKTNCESSSSSFYDGVVFSVNGIVEAELDNDDASSWATHTYTLTQGDYSSIKWEYQKDGSVTSGSDTAWIDNIYLGPPKSEIEVTGIDNGDTVERIVLADEAVDMTYTIRNIGEAPLYVGNIMLDNPDFSVTQQPASEIAPQDHTKFIISITVGEGQTKTTSVMIPNSDEDEAPFMFNMSVEGVDAEPGYLFMMYMDGDNNLESLLWGDINEMEYGLYQMDPALRDTVHILVLWDGTAGYDSTTPAGGKLYELAMDDSEDNSLADSTIDHTSEKWWPGDEVDMGDGATITSFITWARAKYPGMMNEVFIMSNHGGGVKSNDLPDRYGWSDNDNGTHLYTNEIQQGFLGAGCDSDTLSIIGMDACIMSAVEEAYEYRNVGDFFIASPENEGGDGWEFDDWLPNMELVTDPRALSQIIVESYRDDIGGSQCLTATDLSQMENLKTKIDELAAAMYAEGDEAGVKAVINSTASNGNSCWYLGELFQNIANATTLSQSLKGLGTDARNVLGDAIVYSWRGSYYSGPQYDGVGTDTQEGLVIEKSSHTWYTTDVVGEYGELDFCNESNDGTVNTWKELLDAWY
jgi:hypothetical protein